MIKKLLIALLCMQLLLAGCTSKNPQDDPKEQPPEPTVEEEAPAQEEKEDKTPAEAAPTQQKKTPPDISSQQEKIPPDISSQQEKTPPDISSQQEKIPPDISSQQEKTPPDISSQQEKTPPDISSQQETATDAPKSPVQVSGPFDVSLLDTFKECSTIKIDGYGCFASYENGTSFDPFIDDLKDILKDRPVITLNKEQQKLYDKKNSTAEDYHSVVHLHVISTSFDPCLYVLDDFVELEYHNESTFISIDEDITNQIIALVKRTPGDRDPDINKNLDPEKPNPALG